MSNLENLIQKILEDGRKEAKVIAQESQMNNKEILDSKIDEANDNKDKIIERANRDASMLKERIISEAELKVRDKKLKAKREILDRVFDRAKDELANIGEDDYLNFLKGHMNKMNLKGTEVLIVPEKYKEIVKKSGIYSNISNEESVATGFLLKDGNININYSFESLVDFRREDIEVEIAQKLFQEWE